MRGDSKVLCLARNEEVVEAAHHSEALYPHKHSHSSQANNRDERLLTLYTLKLLISGKSHIFCFGVKFEISI